MVAGVDADVHDLIDSLMSRITSREKIKALEYPGGDSYIIDDLLRALSYAPCRKCVLVEVFGGSGLVSQYAPRSKFHVIVYNDADRLLAEFHRMVKEDPELLVLTLSLLPYSRYIHDELRKLALRHGDELEGILAASILFYVVMTSECRVITKEFNVGKARREAAYYASSVKAILETAKNFRDVVIENLDFTGAITKYDSENTVFYLDPPYIGRNYYRLNFTPHQARRLSHMLNNIKGYYLLKIIEDQLPYYNIPYKSKIVLDKPLYFQLKFNEGVRQKIVLLSNYEVGLTLPSNQSKPTPAD